MSRSKLFYVMSLLLAFAVGAIAVLPWNNLQAQSGGGDWQAVVAERGFTDADVYAAVTTYHPSGVYDEFVMFASGGHSGQVFAIGLPSMRLLRTISVFTPEPWQGYGYGAGNEVLEQGNINGNEVLWGDTHHPALSETDAQYDGQFLFIGDKANGRVAVIDLRDFETKQIVVNPHFRNDHGGTFVTPNTEYIIEGGQYSMPIGGEYAPISDYQTAYDGIITLWKFDRETGRIDQSQSFSIQLPPYWQDLCDSGKLVSDGWIFCNSINSEMATGGIEEGNPPFEAGVSRNTTDYLHIINYRAAVAAFEAGQGEMINGMAVLSLETAVSEGILFLAPEPRSPHGVDVMPHGDYMVVAGKLDPHVTVFSFAKIQEAIAAANFEFDPFGVPVLNFDAVVEAQVELGLGPLHTQFDDQGYAYTSLFLDSAVARWSIGAEGYRPQDGWQLIEKIPVQYNVGHIAVAEGDTANPAGNFLVALNKWSVDRFLSTGPLLPQNLQLIDISPEVGNMTLLYDMPLTAGEPHYAQIMRAERLQVWDVYPEAGWDPTTQSVDPNAVMQGQEGVTRDGTTVTVRQTAIRSHFTPEHIQIEQGDHVIWTVTSLERSRDATHGFAIPLYNINLSIEPGESITFEFDATESGIFTWYCTEFCSALHLEMMGYFMVAPE